MLYRSSILVIFLCFIGQASLHGQVIINSYHAVQGYDPCTGGLSLDNSSSLRVNDTVLIIQMKGAVIDSSNNLNFGAIVNYNSSGKYEFNVVEKIQGNSVRFVYELENIYNFDVGHVQVIKVPTFRKYKIDALHTVPAWNGVSGGVFVLNVEDTLFLNNAIDVSGKGFRGGLVTKSSTYTCNQLNFFYPISSPLGGLKGEGIAIVGNGRLRGRGSLANGGGGGNDTNSGGGGGSNGGRGGNGGRQWEGCNSTIDNGGEGGRKLISTPSQNRFFLGGGGGAAHDNDNNSDNGGSGGGIVIINGGVLVGNGVINANGENCSNAKSQLAVNGDGQSGGGAGGTVAINSTKVSQIRIHARGGNGGSVFVSQKHGPGGGGGGGVIFTNNAINLETNPFGGGQKGVNVISGNAMNAGLGEDGTSYSSFALKTIDGTRSRIKYSIQYTAIECRKYKFTAVSAGNSLVTDFKWDFGDGTSGIGDTIFHTFLSDGDYRVKLLYKLNNNFICFDTIEIVVPVRRPQLKINVDKTTACVGEKFTFNYVSEQGTSYLWRFGDGVNSVDSVVAHVYNSPGAYNVVLVGTSANGCVDSAIKAIVVKNQLNYTIEIKSVGCKTFRFIAKSNSSSLADALSWKFQDGQIYLGDSTERPFSVDGVQSVQLIAMSTGLGFCNDTIVSQFKVAGVSSYFELGTKSVCVDKALTVKNSSKDASSYLWDFGDGFSSTDSVPAHIYNQTGSYTIRLITFGNQCKDTFLLPITVDKVDTTRINATLCPGDTITFGPHKIIKAGTYLRHISMNESCDSVIKLTIVQAALNPDFSFNINGNQVSFKNLTTSTLSTDWDFGDGMTSSDHNPIHSYNSGGGYKVCLKVVDINSCAATKCRNLKIQPKFFLELPSSFTPNGDGKNDVFLARGSGIADFHLRVYNRWGKIVFESKNINVGWDGKYDGQMLPIETVLYIVVAKFINGEAAYRKGDLTIIR